MGEKGTRREKRRASLYFRPVEGSSAGGYGTAAEDCKPGLRNNSLSIDNNYSSRWLLVDETDITHNTANLGREAQRRPELMALLHRLTSHRRSVRDAAERELAAFAPGALGALSLLVEPEWSRASMRILWPVLALQIVNFFVVPWLRGQSLSDWFYLVVGVPFVLYMFNIVVRGMRLLSARRPIAAALRLHLDHYPFSLAEEYFARPDVNLILMRIQRLCRPQPEPLSAQDRTALLTILRTDDPAWSGVRFAVIDALEAVGDGSEIGAIKRLANSAAMSFAAEQRWLAQRAARLLPILHARKRERKEGDELVRAAAREVAIDELLHPSTRGEGTDPVSLLRGSGEEITAASEQFGVGAGHGTGDGAGISESQIHTGNSKRR